MSSPAPDATNKQVPLKQNNHSGASTPLHRIANVPGYATPPFKGKDEQYIKVHQHVLQTGFIPPELVKGEVNWFYKSLGIDDTYFENEAVQVISDHIIALYGAKVLAYTKHDINKLIIDLDKVVTPDPANGIDGSAMFIHSSIPGVSATDGPGATCEKKIDSVFLDNSTPEHAYRVESYRSAGAISAGNAQQLRCYFVSKCNFPKQPANSDPAKFDIRDVSDSQFLSKATPNTLQIYQEVMEQVLTRYGPVMELFEVEGTRERRIVVGYKMGATQKFFSALSDLYHYYGLYSKRKYVEQFSNGVTIISLYLNPLPNSAAPPIEASIMQVVKEISLLYTIPLNPFFSPSPSSLGHAVQEATYAYCGQIFAQHFCNRLGPAYAALRTALDESNPAHAEVLNGIKVRLREETFTREAIEEVVRSYPDLIRVLYVHFAAVHYPDTSNHDAITPTLSYQRLQATRPLSDQELTDLLRKTVTNKHDLQVLEAFATFNKHVLKTNFYQPTKVALSFRLNPEFLPTSEYPRVPFGMFFVIGSEFRGFHLRFRDVARGGIRIIRSRGRETYSINQRMLFDENYALASTQSLKNKDIPEGGAKGTILPSLNADPRICFEKYVDAIVDLLIPGSSPGIKDSIVDLYGKPELLFLGPDEGTADMMDWAALHARSRNAPWWKSFTTGKSAAHLGGVPHDTYGMTSLSVRQYVVGIYEHLGLDEKEITKVQTGGPDGDLGSNEILLSNDKTVAVIDGSGVLADPEGINREELVRLAKLRVPVGNFDTSKLSKEGYLVRVEDQDITLPSGELVADGTDFRNCAHLRFKSDIFVPCGGRPEAINISNVGKLIDLDGKPHFKYIVEGANLFLTQQARLFLEKRKVVTFKDASANKGGVTSSSLEVLAGLALSDQEYLDLMLFKDNKPTDFYNAYVKDIQQKITENARAEFLCIWREYERLNGTKPRTLISDELSSTLNDLQADLEASDLFDDVPSRRGVLGKAIPRTLVDKVGLDTLLKRLPEPYQRALFSSWVASHFIYQYGVTGSSVDFFHFARNLAN